MAESDKTEDVEPAGPAVTGPSFSIELSEEVWATFYSQPGYPPPRQPGYTSRDETP